MRASKSSDDQSASQHSKVTAAGRLTATSATAQSFAKQFSTGGLTDHLLAYSGKAGERGNPPESLSVGTWRARGPPGMLASAPK